MPNEVLSAAQLKELVKRVVVAQGNTFIKSVAMETADGPMPDAGESFYRRFGGLRGN